MAADRDTETDFAWLEHMPTGQVVRWVFSDPRNSKVAWRVGAYLIEAREADVRLREAVLTLITRDASQVPMDDTECGIALLNWLVEHGWDTLLLGAGQSEWEANGIDPLFLRVLGRSTVPLEIQRQVLDYADIFTIWWTLGRAEGGHMEEFVEVLDDLLGVKDARAGDYRDDNLTTMLPEGRWDRWLDSLEAGIWERLDRKVFARVMSQGPDWLKQCLFGHVRHLGRGESGGVSRV